MVGGIPGPASLPLRPQGQFVQQHSVGCCAGAKHVPSSCGVDALPNDWHENADRGIAGGRAAVQLAPSGPVNPSSQLREAGARGIVHA